MSICIVYIEYLPENVEYFVTNLYNLDVINMNKYQFQETENHRNGDQK